VGGRGGTTGSIAILVPLWRSTISRVRALGLVFGLGSEELGPQLEMVGRKAYGVAFSPRLEAICSPAPILRGIRVYMEGY